MILTMTLIFYLETTRTRRLREEADKRTKSMPRVLLQGMCQTDIIQVHTIFTCTGICTYVPRIVTQLSTIILTIPTQNLDPCLEKIFYPLQWIISKSIILIILLLSESPAVLIATLFFTCRSTRSDGDNFYGQMAALANEDFDSDEVHVENTCNIIHIKYTYTIYTYIVE